MIGQLKEMVILPLLYPTLYRQMGITPARLMPCTPAEMLSALEALEVRACDWREALMSAPEACAHRGRGSMAAMSAAAAQALPARLGPALLPACASALQVCCMLLTPSALSELRCVLALAYCQSLLPNHACEADS